MNSKLIFPPTKPPGCTKSCKQLFCGNTDTFTLAIYCENRKYEDDETPTFCSYMFSCGEVVRGKIKIPIGQTLKQTVALAVIDLLPKITNLTQSQKQASTNVN